MERLRRKLVLTVLQASSPSALLANSQVIDLKHVIPTEQNLSVLIDTSDNSDALGPNNCPYCHASSKECETLSDCIGSENVLWIVIGITAVLLLLLLSFVFCLHCTSFG